MSEADWAGARLAGPAMLIEETGTTVVEPELAGAVTAKESSGADPPAARTRAHRHKGRSDDAGDLQQPVHGDRRPDGRVLQNTAHSVNIKERLDFSCAVFDGDGELVANAPHVPVHLGSMGESVKPSCGPGPGRCARATSI